MSKTLNAKGRPFSWSYSALADFEGCPLRYAHAKFYCTTKFQDSAALRWGNRVHKAAELAIKGTPHGDPEAFKPVAKYVKALQDSGHFLMAEQEVTLTEGMQLTGWFAKNAWFRCKVDVTAIKHKSNTAILWDWKTGKMREGDDQLRICIAALAQTLPGVSNFEGRYIWTKFGQATPIAPIARVEIPKIWGAVLPRVARMQQAWDTDTFPAKPSGLCPFCDVQTCAKRR